MGVPEIRFAQGDESTPRTWDGIVIPHYSTDIAAAFEITKRICNTWGFFYHDVYVEWQVVCDHQRRTFDDCRFGAQELELPHAICLAALKAVGAL